LAIRRERGAMSQASLAHALEVTQPMVSDWEAGKKRPGVDQLRKIEGLLRLPAGHFLRIGGYVDVAGERTTEEAIMGDPVLNPDHKQALLAAYESFRESAQRAR
jgi:transcriptional regulator with XRE-family HTH domain